LPRKAILRLRRLASRCDVGLAAKKNVLADNGRGAQIQMQSGRWHVSSVAAEVLTTVSEFTISDA